MTTTTLTPATAELAKFFDAYGIFRLEVTDAVDDIGIDVQAYDHRLNYIVLGVEADDCDTVDGYDWETYVQLLFDFFGERVGDYTAISAGIQRRQDGSFECSGDVTKRVSF